MKSVGFWGTAAWAWFVSIDLGFVFWQDFTCHYYVRAVCSF